MGLNYTFILVFPLASVDDALRALAGHLHADDRVRMLAALPWQPAKERLTSWRGTTVCERSGFSSLERNGLEHGDSFCLSLLIRLDRAVREYELTDVPLPREGKLASLGCMWTEFSTGSELFVISMMAASSGMSRLCEMSEAVQAPLKSVARSANAFALFLDTEQPDSWTLLYPQVRAVPRPDDELFDLPDDLSPATDAYWSDALEKAGVAWTTTRMQ